MFGSLLVNNYCDYEEKIKQAESQLSEAESIKRSQLEMLEKISGYTKEQAKVDLIATLEESLKRTAEIGYKYIQISGVCEYDAEWVAERCREYGLKIVITHFDYNKIINETEETIAFHKKMDCPYIGLGSAKGAMLGDSYNNLVNEIPEAVEKIAAAGLKFMYHNHSWEYETKLSSSLNAIYVFEDVDSYYQFEEEVREEIRIIKETKNKLKVERRKICQ